MHVRRDAAGIQNYRQAEQERQNERRRANREENEGKMK